MPSVFFQTFGCQMNVADSNEAFDRLYIHGFRATEDPHNADLIVINTCSVREHAENRAKVRIAEFCRIKKKGAKLWVIGCMAQRLGESLKAELQGVDRVIGSRSLDRIEEIALSEFGLFPAASGRVVTGHDVSDFVSIMRGCNNYCAYCIVPYVRGPESSIPATQIIDIIRKKVSMGVREVTLLGQNVNSYRDNGIDFPDLLNMICLIDGIERVRFTTSHPKDCNTKLIRTVAEQPKCCHHFHLPVQSGSDRILSLMNRRYTASGYRELIRTIRSVLPGADVTTDILVGFPSETEEDFEATLTLVEEVRFTSAFMFAYSVRAGTAAASMPDDVMPDVKQDRLRRLIRLQTAITKEEYSAMVGRQVRLMIGDRSKDGLSRTARDNGCKRALITCDDLKAGTILDANVVRSSGMTLICERIQS